MPFSPKRDQALRRRQGTIPGGLPRHTDVQTTPTADPPAPPSKSQRKRDAHALQALGAQLVALSPGHLAQLDLPDGLRAAVVAARGMRQHGARLRQMQYIGKCMRQLEPAVLRRVHEALPLRRAVTARGRVPPCGG